MKIAKRYGWLPGARYSNLRDIRGIDEVGLIDIDWERYSFKRHLEAVKAVRPLMTVARDLTSVRDTDRLLDQIAALREHVDFVIVVPKTRKFSYVSKRLQHRRNILGYSVPTGYGSTSVPVVHFAKEKVHLLGGRPMTQFKLAHQMNVVSLDCNSITIDAAFGKYFDGTKYIKTARLGYLQCLAASLEGINSLWEQVER